MSEMSGNLKSFTGKGASNDRTRLAREVDRLRIAMTAVRDSKEAARQDRGKQKSLMLESC